MTEPERESPRGPPERDPSRSPPGRATTATGLEPRGPASTEPRLGHDATLVDLLDRVLDRGVTVTGDVILSVAGVDLVYLGVRLVLKSIDGDEGGL